MFTVRIDSKAHLARETNFKPYHDPSLEYSRMLSELTQDPDRNALIASDVAQEAQGNGGGVWLSAV